METVKDILNFCNNAVFYDYKNVGIICELNEVHKCTINSFHKTIPYTRILRCLSIIGDMILKINNDNIEIIIEKIHDLRVNIIYMFSFKKTVRHEEKAEFDGTFTE